MKRNKIIILIAVIGILAVVSACTASDVAAFSDGYERGYNSVVGY